MITPEKPAHSALRGKCAPIVPPLLRPTFPRPREAERTLRQNRGKSRLRHLPVWGSHLFGPPGGLFGSLWSHSERKHNWVLVVHNGPYFQRHLLSLLRSQKPDDFRPRHSPQSTKRFPRVGCNSRGFSSSGFHAFVVDGGFIRFVV